MADRGACRECAGTGWACQPPRCDHPLHVNCPWCLGTGKASTPQVIADLQDALVAIQDIALADTSALSLSIESIARHALRESAWESITLGDSRPLATTPASTRDGAASGSKDAGQ